MFLTKVCKIKIEYKKAEGFGGTPFGPMGGNMWWFYVAGRRMQFYLKIGEKTLTFEVPIKQVFEVVDKSDHSKCEK